MVVVECDRDLVQVVLALAAGRRLADFLHSGHQQTNENRNDGDNDQQLDQRKRGPTA